MSKQFYIIYETKNLKNGKTYIGMHETNNLEDGYLGSGKRLKRAIRYYGKEYFTRKILHIFDNKSEMINKEVELVNDEFINRKDTYNLMLGGSGGWYNDDTQLRCSIAGGKALAERLKNDEDLLNKYKINGFNKLKELWQDSVFREKALKNIDWTGRKHSKESKLKMSNADRTGSKNSQFGKMWITNGIENKKIDKNNDIPEGWFPGRKMK